MKTEETIDEKCLDEERRIVNILDELKSELNNKIDVRIVELFSNVIKCNQNNDELGDNVPITDEKLCSVFNIETKDGKIPHDKLSDVTSCSFDIYNGILEFSRISGGLKDKKSGKRFPAYWVKYVKKEE